MREIEARDWLEKDLFRIRYSAAAWIAPELLYMMMTNVTIRRNGTLYSAHRLGKHGVEGDRWHLSWMYSTLRDDGKKFQIRNVNPEVMPFNIPGNDKLPAIRRYYKLPSDGFGTPLITRQLTVGESYEAIWQACGFLEDAGYMKRGERFPDFRTALLLQPGEKPCRDGPKSHDHVLIPDLTARPPFFRNGPLESEVPIWREPTKTYGRKVPEKDVNGKPIRLWDTKSRPTYTPYVPKEPRKKSKRP